MRPFPQTAMSSGVLADMGLPEWEARAGNFAFRFSTVPCVCSFNNQARVLAFVGETWVLNLISNIFLMNLKDFEAKYNVAQNAFC